MGEQSTQNSAALQKPFGLPWAVLLAGFCLAAAGACFDYNLAFPKIDIQGRHTAFCFGFLALLALGDREGRMGRRLALTLGTLAGTLLLAWAMRHHVGGLALRNVIKPHAVLNLVRDSPAPYLWAAALWLASPILGGGWTQDAGDAGGRYSRPLRVAVWALMVYGALCFGSAAASQDPAKSLSLFYHERALTFALLAAWLRAAGAAPALRAATGRFAVWLLAALMLAGTVVGLADLAGPAALREKLAGMNDEEHKIVYVVTAEQTEKTVPVRRLQYPMLHFNRTAYLAMIAALAFFVANFTLGRRRRGLERWVLAGLAPAFFVMILSYTRGVTAAAVAALCAWAALVSRRALIAIVVACVLVALALPAGKREHYLSIFNPATYRIEKGNITSMALRMLGWEYGLGVVGQMPLTGLGYGTQVVREDYLRYIAQSGNRRLIHDVTENATHQHMHNLWLEIAVESGVPALLAFMMFTAARWWMLGGAWRRWRGEDRRRLAAWLAFELAILIAGTIYYMLKHNFGMINFFVWGYMMSELEELRSVKKEFMNSE